VAPPFAAPAHPGAARLFLALWPDRGLQDRLAGVGREIVRTAGGRATAAANIHLTLCFLGTVEVPERTCIEGAAGAVRGAPFRLTLDRAGSFRSGVAWVGAPAAPAALTDLQRVLATAARECGVALDPRPFVVHLTVARDVRRRFDVPVEPLDWPVDRFRLVASELRPDGPIYRPLAEWPLAAPDSPANGAAVSTPVG
jgi:2'-5' RNA ligase